MLPLIYKIGIFGGFINKTTRQIAQKPGITKYVASYIIKPSSITLDFNKQVNPKIIQRKARHRKIETTLRYDHVSDDMVRDYFNKFISGLITDLNNKKIDQKGDTGYA
jgi:site-specific recombinase XerD